MKPVVHVVATQCRSENEKKFNKWYNETHIPMLLKFKGITEVNRYQVLSGSPGPRYLASYRFESQDDFEAFQKSPELAAAISEMKETWGENGIDIKFIGQYELINTWRSGNLKSKWLRRLQV